MNDKPVIMDATDYYNAKLEAMRNVAKQDAHMRECFPEMLAALEACAEAFKDTATKDGGALYQKASTAYEAALIAISRAKGGKA